MEALMGGAWWQILIAVGAGLLLIWLALLTLLWITQRHGPDPTSLRDAIRLLPDVIRLLRRLAADPDLPRGVRIRLGLLVCYLILPIDLIPDFIPVLGYADDAIVVALALRSVVRRARPAVLAKHWPGTPDGLRIVQRLAGLPVQPAPSNLEASQADSSPPGTHGSSDTRMRARLALERERGSLSAFFAVVVLASLVMIGLAVDGGHKAQATQRAVAVADEAARAGGNAIDVLAATQSGSTRVDPVAAVAAAQAYLSAAGVSGAVTVDDGGQTLTVETTLQVQTVFLNIVGVDVLTVTGRGAADLVLE